MQDNGLPTFSYVIIEPTSQIWGHVGIASAWLSSVPVGIAGLSFASVSPAWQDVLPNTNLDSAYGRNMYLKYHLRPPNFFFTPLTPSGRLAHWQEKKCRGIVGVHPHAAPHRHCLRSEPFGWTTWPGCVTRHLRVFVHCAIRRFHFVGFRVVAIDWYRRRYTFHIFDQVD